MPIDYVALAKQAGATSSTPPPGKVDYAALAKQAGATSSTPTADAPVAGAGDYGVPQPAAHSAVDMQPSLLGSPGRAVFGDKPISDSISMAGSHLKNMVAGPYHAFTDAPRNPEEQSIKGADADSSLPARSLGQFGLGASRMLLQPTSDAMKEAGNQLKKGNYAPLNNYDGEGNYHPSVQSSLMDAVPIIGPWNRNFQNDANQKGIVPALAGLATDIYAPKAAAGLYGGAMKAAKTGLQAAATTPEGLKIAATRSLVTGSPGEMLNRALKPPVTKPDFEQSIEASLPSIAAQKPVGVRGFAEAAKNSQAAEQDWYKSLTQPLGHFQVDASPIADAQIASIPLIDKIESPATLQGGSPGRFKTVTVPAGEGSRMTMGGTVGARPAELRGGIVNDTAEVAGNYRRPMPLSVIDSVRQGSNQKLAGFFAKAGGDKYAAMANPETARMAAVNDASRDLAYDNFSRLSAAGRTDGGVPVADIADNQNLFGHLSDVADVAGKRATVAGRANPLSLQESLSLHGNPLNQAYNFATSRLFKKLTDSDAVTNAAVDRYINPDSLFNAPRPTAIGKGLYGTAEVAGRASKINPFVAPLANASSKGDRKKSLLFSPR